MDFSNFDYFLQINLLGSVLLGKGATTSTNETKTRDD
jgi:hypothetical protein